MELCYLRFVTGGRGRGVALGEIEMEIKIEMDVGIARYEECVGKSLGDHLGSYWLRVMDDWVLLTWRMSMSTRMTKDVCSFKRIHVSRVQDSRYLSI